MNTSTSCALFVFIHGMWEKPSCWKFLKKHLDALDYVCVATRLKYHTEDTKNIHPNLGTTSILDYAEDLEKQIEHIRETYPKHKLVLIGHSMGGLLAQILLSRNPSHYQAGIFLTPASPAGTHAMCLSTLRCSSNHLNWGCWRKPFKLSNEKYTYALYQGIEKTRRQKIIHDLQHESGRAATEIGFWQIDKILHFLNGKGWKAATSVNFNLAHNMLFVGAEKDKITPVSTVKKTACRYNAQYEEITKAPHYILEHKETLDLILSFIRQDQPPTVM